MKKPTIIILAALFILVSALCASAADAPVTAASAADKVAAIQKAYEGIKDIRGSFVQKSTIRDLKKTETYKGQFLIKAKKMRWEYKGDKQQIVYITGKEIIIYQPQQKQAFRAPFSPATYGQAPIALLSGFGNIDKEFTVALKDEKLILTPKAAMGNVTSVELKPSDEGFPIKAITVIDKLNNRVDIDFTEVKTNTNIKNSMFVFKAPEGVAVLEQ